VQRKWKSCKATAGKRRNTRAAIIQQSAGTNIFTCHDQKITEKVSRQQGKDCFRHSVRNYFGAEKMADLHEAIQDGAKTKNVSELVNAIVNATRMDQGESRKLIHTFMEHKNFQEAADWMAQWGSKRAFVNVKLAGSGTRSKQKDRNHYLVLRSDESMTYLLDSIDGSVVHVGSPLDTPALLLGRMV
jgi:hypothetical protein